MFITFNERIVKVSVSHCADNDLIRFSSFICCILNRYNSTGANTSQLIFNNQIQSFACSCQGSFNSSSVDCQFTLSIVRYCKSIRFFNQTIVSGSFCLCSTQIHFLLTSLFSSQVFQLTAFKNPGSRSFVPTGNTQVITIGCFYGERSRDSRYRRNTGNQFDCTVFFHSDFITHAFNVSTRNVGSSNCSSSNNYFFAC